MREFSGEAGRRSVSGCRDLFEAANKSEVAIVILGHITDSREPRVSPELQSQ